MDLIIQMIGFAGMIVIISCFYCRRHKQVLLIADVLWMLHYFLLGAFSGAATNLICCMREIVYKVEKTKRDDMCGLCVFFVKLDRCVFDMERNLEYIACNKKNRDIKRRFDVYV